MFVVDASVPGSSPHRVGKLGAEGRRVADLIWGDDPVVRTFQDPHLPEFANAVIDGLAEALQAAPGVLQRVMSGAASAAEDLNVEPFQGLVEILQNADDLSASEVRFAIRARDDRPQQLLIVHDGRPVTCHHVLPMTLPYLTTKAEDALQKGRFGVGLKTLRRISTRVAVHCRPYNFRAEALVLQRTEPEAALGSFYHPAKDTMIVLDLVPSFESGELRQWFDRWDDDGLLFLNTVRSFRWCKLSGATIGQKSVSAGPWKTCDFRKCHELSGVRRRKVTVGNRVWTVFSADVPVPAGFERAHKAKGETTTVSIAVGPQRPANGLYIAFRTRVRTELPFTIDAQFDPSTARDALIQNPWNSWLIEQCADVLIRVACGLLLTDPKRGWPLIPLGEEYVGAEIDQWPRSAFKVAFERVRREIAEKARLVIDGVGTPLRDVAYEDESITGLLGSDDIERLFPGKKALPKEARDEQNRWRAVLNQLRVSRIVGTAELLGGFSAFAFGDKPAAWWVDAADRITKHHSNPGEILDVPCWLSTEASPVACRGRETPSRPLVFGGTISRFCRKWRLLDRLHDAYGGQSGEHALSWLRQNAAFAESPDAEIELRAFAEMNAENPVEIADNDLREVRDRFDGIPDYRANSLGRRVGAALLLDGYTYRSRRRVLMKVSPQTAYLPRTVDGDHPHWPEAADGLPGIEWLSAGYYESLRIGATRQSRKRADGTAPRGARKFLMLLGAECAPRVVEQKDQVGTGALREQELRDRGAELVSSDYASPDLERFLDALPKFSRRQRRSRSAALLRTLSRHWARLYARHTEVTAMHAAKKYWYQRGQVTAIWLCRLREMGWVAVGDGELVEPGRAVIKSAQTETMYDDAEFVWGVQEGDVSPHLAKALGLITEVRVSDLVAHLRSIRDEAKPVDPRRVLEIYRSLARSCPDSVTEGSWIGDLRAIELRERFAEGSGLICIETGEWRRPTEIFSGNDIFHRPDRFVPGGSTYQNLWRALDIRRPDLFDCIQYCRELAGESYSSTTEAALIDVYRYMESLEPQTEGRRMKMLPLACGGSWTSNRPIYFIDDRELRNVLAEALPRQRFWIPPCDVRTLPNLTKAFGLTVLDPVLTVCEDLQRALDLGEALRPRFQRAVDHLSNELARYDQAARDKLSITWDELRKIHLFVYDEPFAVIVEDPQLERSRAEVVMKALATNSRPRELHLWDAAVGLRDQGGRVIGSLFAPDVQRWIEAEWSASWLASEQLAVEPMRLASDQERAQALAELAQNAQTAPPGKIKVAAPATRTSPAKPRMLKESLGEARIVTILPGTPAKPASDKPAPPLVTTPPSPSPSSGSVPVTPPGYTNTDVEQKGWEVLTDVLNRTDAPTLIDFRRRRGVGADGAIDWKKFVEMKATGRTPQSSIEMSNTEHERAKAGGLDFILALVSGLEEGETTEVRLILDPVNKVKVQPIQGVRLVNLADAPAVLIRWKNDSRTSGE